MKTLAVALVSILIGLAVVAVFLLTNRPVRSETTVESADPVQVRLMGPEGTLQAPAAVPKVALDPSEWQSRLDATAYHVLREKGTERAFTGPLEKNKEAGIYACAGCSLPLFESSAKFDSGTGWPSFHSPIARENVAEEEDRSYGMVRTEVLCPRCDGHLGHVFNDGPAPTGLRYCMNSAALRFVKAEEAATLAEAAPDATAKKTDSAPGKWLPLPEKDADKASASGESRAIFAGGCFWCTEAVFEEVPGVKNVVSGYTGGDPSRADYKSVTSGTTGHAEAIEITYDPRQVSFGELMRIFFATHDPTTLNRQGPDKGTQYRSAIFATDEQQKTLAEAYIAQLNAAGKFRGPIVTEVKMLDTFHAAEAYHQDFVRNQPDHGYVQMWAVPKVEKVRELLKDEGKLKE